MAISNVNDPYFWVILKLSSFNIKSMLRVYSQAFFLMGPTAIGFGYFLSLFLS